MLENPSLEKSDLYFAILQVLRLMSEWIDSSSSDLTRLQERALIGMEYLPLTPECGRHAETMKNVDIPAIRNNWNILLSRHKELKERLLFKIHQMKGDLETLRDGVSGLAVTANLEMLMAMA
jgi:hypothetical protein